MANRRPVTHPAHTDRPVAIVTGATGGMGRLIVADLVRDHRVIAVGRDQGILRDLAEAYGAETFAADLAAAYDARVARELAEGTAVNARSASEPGAAGVSGTGPADEFTALAELADHVDVVVHAAAIARSHSVASAPAAEWHRHFSLNVGVPAVLTAELLPKLRASHGISVFINSGAGSNPQPGNAVYAASKHALFGLVDSLRKEEANAGVRVTTVSPGPTDTPMLHDMRGGGRMPVRYIIDPQEIARAVRFVVDAGPTTQITNVDVRPRIELAERQADAFDA